MLRRPRPHRRGDQGRDPIPQEPGGAAHHLPFLGFQLALAESSLRGAGYRVWAGARRDGLPLRLPRRHHRPALQEDAPSATRDGQDARRLQGRRGGGGGPARGAGEGGRRGRGARVRRREEGVAGGARVGRGGGGGAREAGLARGAGAARGRVCVHVVQRGGVRWARLVLPRVGRVHRGHCARAVLPPAQEGDGRAARQDVGD
mmetsp:Transcript_28597/g.91622  ORF Transcript_28597/g.91622 Transcript_28597/m.91622 type:complete len:203 (-) Transcript_28597:223-831(-)